MNLAAIVSITILIHSGTCVTFMIALVCPAN